MTDTNYDAIVLQIREDLNGGMIKQGCNDNIQESFMALISTYNDWRDAIDSAARHGFIDRFAQDDLRKIVEDTYDEEVFWLAEAAVDRKEER